MVRNEILSGFLFCEMVRNGIPSIFVFPGMVRNKIVKFKVFFSSTKFAMEFWAISSSVGGLERNFSAETVGIPTEWN